MNVRCGVTSAPSSLRTRLGLAEGWMVLLEQWDGALCCGATGANSVPGVKSDATHSDRHATSMRYASTPVNSRPRLRRNTVKVSVPRMPVRPAKPVAIATKYSFKPFA